MTEETKDKIKLIFYILFYPICGFFEILKGCKGSDLLDFINDWAIYLFGVFFWICSCATIGFIVYSLKYQFVQTIIPISIIFAIIFFTVILPYIIHKLINKK